MPQAIPAAIAAAASSAVAGATTAGVLASVFTSLALSGLSLALAPKQERPDFGSFESQGFTRQFRQAISERRIVYGETRVSGAVLPIASTDNNRYLHMCVLLASHEIEAIDELIINEESVPLDYLDNDGNVIDGRYNGYLRVKKHLGAEDQTADSDLVNEVAGWTTNHRLRGIAYMYVRLEWNRDVYPNGIPNFSAWVKGRKVVDTRDIIGEDDIVTDTGENIVTDGTEKLITGEGSSTATRTYSANIALQAIDYLTYERYGIGADYSRISDDDADVAANLCDEMVDVKELNIVVNNIDIDNDIITANDDDDILRLHRGDLIRLTGGSVGGLSAGVDYYAIPYQRQGTPRFKLSSSFDGAMSDTDIVNITGTNAAGTFTKYQEPRYHGGGVLKTSAEYGKNLQEILTGMGGAAVFSGGKWYLSGLSYQTPTISLDEDDLVGAISVQSKTGRRDRFNGVQGVFTSPVNRGNPSDYPIVTNSTYVTQDGKEITKKFDLPFAQRSNTAQRIGKIYLERERQEIKFEAAFSIAALKLKAGDNFYFSFERYGWTNKVFEVVEWAFEMQDGAPVVKMTCRENASAVYDFTASTEELDFDPAPNTSLPNAFEVDAVTGFSLSSIPVLTQDGDKTYKINATWDTHPNRFVLQDGRIEIAYKLATESSYKFYPPVDGASTDADLFQAEPDTLYDVRIRAINNIGATSNYTTITGFRVGSTGGITDTEDWENETITARNNQDWESDTLTSEDWE